MTWTYSLTDLADSERDQIRMEIGDTDQAATVTLADEEIVQALAVESGFWGACARCCELLARRYLLKADVQLGRDLRLQYSTMAKQYADTAATLRQKDLGTALPYVGGRSVSEKISRSQDTDAVQPIFTRTMQENPWVGAETSDSLQDDDGTGEV